MSGTENFERSLFLHDEKLRSYSNRRLGIKTTEFPYVKWKAEMTKEGQINLNVDASIRPSLLEYRQHWLNWPLDV